MLSSIRIKTMTPQLLDFGYGGLQIGMGIVKVLTVLLLLSILLIDPVL